VWITGWFMGCFTWWLAGSAYGVLDSSRNYTHMYKKPKCTKKVINLCRTKIIEAKHKAKKVSVVYNLQIASQKQCCSSKSSYRDHLPLIPLKRIYNF
jgi:hypothetical protein